MKTITVNLKQCIRYACLADKRSYRQDHCADKPCNRHDRRADKQRYGHDRRADSQCPQIHQVSHCLLSTIDQSSITHRSSIDKDRYSLVWSH